MPALECKRLARRFVRRRRRLGRDLSPVLSAKSAMELGALFFYRARLHGRLAEKNGAALP